MSWNDFYWNGFGDQITFHMINEYWIGAMFIVMMLGIIICEIKTEYWSESYE